MLNCAKLERQPRVFQSLTGLSLVAFGQLLPAFEQAYAAALGTADVHRPHARPRQRGGGRKATLATLADKLVFILFYFRQYPTQAAQGFFLGISQGQACTWIHRLTPVLNQALGAEQQLPARQPAAVMQVLATCPDLAFIVDGTERSIQRPQDAERRRQYDSGKKKRHTVKNIVITHQASRKIKALGPTCDKKHDKAAVDETAFLFPPGSRVWKDTGFQGYEPPGTTTYQPKKKPRGDELTPAEKGTNQAIARDRIGVEPSIGGTKVFRIVHDVFRNHCPAFDDLVMVTVCGLFNLRLDFRPQVA